MTRAQGGLAMRGLRLVGMLLVLSAVATPAGAQSYAPASGHNLNVVWPISDKVTSNIIFYPTPGPDPVAVPARFNVPKNASGRVPAVVYVHGTSGVDGRGAFNDWVLNEAGIATLEIDMWGARGLAPGPTNRRALQPTLPFAFGALLFLANQPMIDPTRIGVEGESIGGGVTLRTASRRFVYHFTQGRLHFAAHLAFYPNCTEFVTSESLLPVTPAPVHILLGDSDADTSADDCMTVAKQIGAGITVYPGVTHQWDEQQGHAFSFYDPLADRGAGGHVEVVPSPATAVTSRAFGVSFFREAFGLP